VKLLILRPAPGAEESAARARALGLDPIVAPLFEIRPIAWTPPAPAAFEAVMLTSANAARHGGDGMTPFLSLPCWTVGEATAEAAAARGFTDIRVGPSDGAALIEAMKAAGVRSAFHPCGLDHLPLEDAALRINRRVVYEARAAATLSPAMNAALDANALVLLHSPRAARTFAALASARRATTVLAAISAATAEAAGPGWRSLAIAPEPRDAALLELAAKLCQTTRD